MVLKVENFLHSAGLALAFYKDEGVVRMKYGKWLYALCSLILLSGIAGSILVLRKPNTNNVRITRDGEVLYQLDLAQEEDRIIEIEYDGNINIVEIKEHQIRIADAGCPDKICVQMGWLDSSVPIVCLPNHLVIQFLDLDEVIDAEAY